MQVVGFSFGELAPPHDPGADTDSPPGPLRRGYVRFSDLTAIVGPNDSGKSQLLARVAQVLEGTREDVFFVACSARVSALATHALSDLAADDEGWT